MTPKRLVVRGLGAFARTVAAQAQPPLAAKSPQSAAKTTYSIFARSSIVAVPVHHVRGPLNRTDSIVVATQTSVTVLLSGGLDSTACLAFYMKQDFAVEGLFFDFGQASATREEDAARAIARHYGAGLRCVRCEGLHPRTGVEVRGRNGFLLLGALMALQGEAGIIGIGIHEGTSYADCTENFIQESQHLFDLYTDGQVRIGAPFIKWTKRQIWDYGQFASIPVALTYSCESGRDQPCGECLSCKDLTALYAC